MAARHGWAKMRFKVDCGLSLTGLWDTSVAFGGLEPYLVKRSGKKPTKKT
jgi:hypothetical protein